MKRILFASAAVALFSAASASACVVDSADVPVMDGAGVDVTAGGVPCSVSLDSSVLFAVGSAVLSSAGREALDALKATSFSTITGYASVDGNDASNESLSVARAQAVAAYLGSDANVVGGGETSQFGDNLQANRVVVLS